MSLNTISEEEKIIDREEILNNAIYESELSDLKQHADKMIRGFENFNNFSSNRAIWELVQNACDLSTDCEVIIDYSNDSFSFTHNGSNFNTKALISLIKQVSGKYGEESEIPEVGKYGTGFLTTHTFGRKFYINSILEANNALFEIKDFLIDRSPIEWKELSKNIKTQKENVYKLIKDGEIVNQPKNKTTFTFLPETPQEYNYISESSKDLGDYIPIVLTINERLKKVTLIINGQQTSFERITKEEISNNNNINLFRTTISKNGEKKVYYSIIEKEDQIEVILPINENHELIQFSERIARLFLYYPLIGSENFGFNFILNCNQFLPTEPRDGIHLKSNKDQLEQQEKENRRIIEKASTLIFDFLKSNVLIVSNPLLYAKINFKRNTENILLNEYFEILQNTWIDEFKLLPIVETSEGFKPVHEACFFNQGLLDSVESFDEIFELATSFYKNIPTKDKVILWSKYVGEWTSESLNFIGHENLVEAISREHLSKFNQETLINYYENLIAEEKINFFSEYTLLPNLDGKLSLLSSLTLPKDIDQILINIGKVLIPKSIEKFVHSDFCFNFNFEKFNRKDFSNNVKTKIDDMQVSNCICLPSTLNTGNYSEGITIEKNLLDYDFFYSLLMYCKLNNNINSQSKPTLLIKIISKYYSLDDELIHLQNLEEKDDNIYILTTRKILVQVFFNLLKHHNEIWVENNLALLFEIANCYEDSLKEVFSVSKIYPNQINQLKGINDLKRDIDVMSEIKDLYNKVTKEEIREGLIYCDFNNFVAEDRFVTNKYLTNQIEDIFFNTDIYNINEHPFKEDILQIISKLSDPKYKELFQILDREKAKLMLDVVTNENTKEDIFSLVTLKESQLKKLGKLVQENNFEAILNAASSLLQQKLESDADFEHKRKIGIYIESLIRQKIGHELQERISFREKEILETSDVQGGQDIIILLDSLPVYYIEVKSRWNSSTSVSMSKLQLQRAVEENNRYALCAVDISRYTGTNDKYNLTAEEILPITKFVKKIGEDIKPLIEDNLEAEKKQYESIHLIDYRGIIPQEIIKGGDDFENFIETLLSIINKVAHNK